MSNLDNLNDLGYFLGQPITTGPLSLAGIGIQQTIQDPNTYASPNTQKVQVQNATGFVVSVQTGVGQFTIQPLTASTIPTADGSSVTVTPVAGVSNFAETLSLVWLLRGQTSPMQDGSINTALPGTPLTSSAIPAVGGSGGEQEILAAPSSGTGYQLYSCIITCTAAASSPAFSVNQITNGSSEITPITAPPIGQIMTVGQQFVTTFPSSLGVQLTEVAWDEALSAPSGNTATLVLNYFLVSL